MTHSAADCLMSLESFITGMRSIRGKYLFHSTSCMQSKRKIEEIRLKMKEAVEAERFEEAAALRDEANTLRLNLEQGGELRRCRLKNSCGVQ